MKLMNYPIFVTIMSLILTAGFPIEVSAQNVGSSGLPLPRFVSFQSDETNMRTGPGTRYPIEWVYRKENMPVEITAEFDIWRRVQDFEGTTGWVHKSTLSGRRTAIVTKAVHNLYKSDEATSSIVATVAPKTIGKIESCNQHWCEVAFGEYEGYMKKTDFWGVYSHELIDD